MQEANAGDPNIRSPRPGSLEGKRVRLQHSALVLACVSSCFAIESDSSPGDLKPYPLPPAARAGIEKLAASSDILILGEMHGTQEVPELVASLLAPLTELGYNTLAVEVPNEEQAALLAWARGKTERIPNFFAKPSGDGRGNAQLLALTRREVSPPYRMAGSYVLRTTSSRISKNSTWRSCKRTRRLQKQMSLN